MALSRNFTSNNYHIFRAGLYARQSETQRKRNRCKTALYRYLPNAILREFIAILVLHKNAILSSVAMVGFAVFSALILKFAQ